MANPFKTDFMRRMYDAMMTAARDPSSELRGKDGTRRTGGSHRCEFWAGYDGIRPAWCAAPGTLGYAAWRAGKDYRKEITQEQRTITTNLEE